MFKVYVFNVNLGDSILLETVQGGRSSYSIIDCKKVGNSAPLVDHLKKHNIKHIHTLFLTHLHQDHCSGFPELAQYLVREKGTLEYFITPNLSEEHASYHKIIGLLFGKSKGYLLDEILSAIATLLELSSVTHANKKPMAIRLNFEGNLTNAAWRTDLHPGVYIAPVSPTSTEAISMLTKSFNRAKLYGTEVNASSNCILVKIEEGAYKHYLIFSGDLEGRTWLAVQNRCLQLAGKDIKDFLHFVKVPHHGSYDSYFLRCLKNIRKSSGYFAASISCPPNDIHHPSKDLIEFIYKNFKDFEVACTNIASCCHNSKGPSSDLDILDYLPEEVEFMEYAGNDTEIQYKLSSTGHCTGSHIFSIKDNDTSMLRSRQSSCNFSVE